MVRTHCPGKLMLLGEYAVLYGKPCIVAAVEPRFTLEAQPDPSLKEDSLQAPELGILQFSPKSELSGKADFLFNALKRARREFSLSSTPLRIRTGGLQPTGKVGLGSSAGSVVSMLTAAAHLAGKAVSKEKQLALAREIILQIQKKGSGFDAAASIYGGIFLYSQEKGVIAHHPFDEKEVALSAAFSGTAASTSVTVAEVAKDLEKRPAHYERIFEKIGILTEEAWKALTERDYEKLGEAMNQNQKLLEQIGPWKEGVSTPEIERILNAARKAGALGAKLSGAGRGDSVIALSRPADKAKVEEAMGAAGGKPLQVRVANEGVTIETTTD